MDGAAGRMAISDANSDAAVADGLGGTVAGVPISKAVAAAAVILIPIAVWFAPLGMDPTARHALAISLFIIIGWITEVLPHAVTGLIGCFLFWATGVVKIDTAFSGFVDQTTWFYLGILLFGL